MMQRYGKMNIPKLNLSRPFRSKGLERVIDQNTSLKQSQSDQLQNSPLMPLLLNSPYFKNTEAPQKIIQTGRKLSKHYYLTTQYNFSQNKNEEKEMRHKKEYKKQNMFKLNSKCYTQCFQQNFTFFNKEQFQQKQEDLTEKNIRYGICQKPILFKEQNINKIEYKSKIIFDKPPLAKKKSIFSVNQIENMAQSTISEIVYEDKNDEEKFQQKINELSYELQTYRKKLKNLLEQRKDYLKKNQQLQFLNKIKRSASFIFTDIFQIQDVI